MRPEPLGTSNTAFPTFLYRGRLAPPVADEESSNREALAYCEARLEHDPDDGVYWILKGNCHYRLGDIGPAADSYGRAVELGEVSSHANFFHALCLIELGRLDEAMRALESQLAITPDHPEALFLLGLCLKLQDEHARGNKLIARVEDIAPGLYGQLYSDYAAALAEGMEDSLLKQGLQDAVGELRRRAQEQQESEEGDLGE